MILLTGATGLLGRYLMRDLLLENQPLAVIVRPSRVASAEVRIDGVLRHWEQQWNRALPRPVVLSGDITQPNLGLDREQMAWVGRHVSSMIHSAASLTFYERDDEPWLSNVQGVRNVLDVCESAGIRTLHHVSSAYTCGLRHGVVHESELDVGQQYGNDYEISKVQAEQLVRSANFLDTLTVHRPSIIVGDSRNGFSSTFHGFYTPLRLICALLTQFTFDRVFSTDYLEMMGLEGHERKNFVPVDWVSRAMVSILNQRPNVSETYALVSQRPVNAGRLMDLYRESVRAYHPGVIRAAASGSNGKTSEIGEPSSVEKAYLEQLSVYKSYWRDDPRFDAANTDQLVGHLPCPEMSDEVLLRLAKTAIESKFAWAPPRGVASDQLAVDEASLRQLASQSNRQPPANAKPLLFSVTGEGGGLWHMSPDRSGQLAVGRGDAAEGVKLRVSSQTFKRIRDRQIGLQQAIRGGEAILIGDEADVEPWFSVI